MRSGFFTRLVIGAALLLPQLSPAQDFHLSQYDAAPLHLNPAMTGLFSGLYRIHAHYRTQWAQVASKPFQTFQASYDMPLKKFSVGGQLMDYKAGAGSYNVFSFLGSIAYDFSVDDADHHHFSFGAQAGFMQKSINFSKLVFENQYTYSNGGGFDNTLPTGENFPSSGIFLPALNAGLVYYYSRENYFINPFVGFSAFNLTHPRENFYGNSDRLPIRYLAHAGAKVNISETIQLQPKVFKMFQTNDRELTFSLMCHYYLKQSDAYLILGPTFRMSGIMGKKKVYDVEDDALIVEAGLKYRQYIWRISYDLNMSSLNPYTNGRGGLEISVTYTGKRPRPEMIDNCPRL
ncbi:MAG: PorP/SprF family type IX secretion system membrane protein [Bacteroidota bacterium]